MERRFFKKEYRHDWWFVFDRKQEYADSSNGGIPFEDADNLVPMSEDQVIELLNDLHDKNEKLEKQLMLKQEIIDSMKGTKFIRKEDNRFQLVEKDGRPRIYNQILGHLYSDEDVLWALNHSCNFHDLCFDIIQEKIWWYQGLKHDAKDMKDDGTIFKLDIKEEALRELRDDFHQPREKLEIYRADLEERFKKIKGNNMEKNDA